jgi:hypothetical protein
MKTLLLTVAFLSGLSGIGTGREPSSLPSGVDMQAAVCELAERTHAGDWSSNLAAVLNPDTPCPARP